MSKFISSLACFLAVILHFNLIAAAQAPTGELIWDDFSYKGIYLGDSKEDIAKMQEEPLFETEVTVLGEDCIRYTFSDNVYIYINKAENKVVEISIRNKKYQARGGVTYGSLPALLNKVYGKSEHLKLEGKACYVYQSKKFPNASLILELDNTYFYVVGMRLTLLEPNTSELVGVKQADPFGLHIGEPNYNRWQLDILRAILANQEY